MIDPTLLTAIPAFRGLDDRSREAVAAVMHRRDYPAGAMILEQGRRMGGVFALLSGAVRVTRALPDGGSVDLVTLGPGALFGALAAIDGGVRAASCIAQEDVTALVLPRMEFTHLMEGRGAVALRFQVGVLSDLFKDLRATNQRLAQLAALPEEEPSVVEVEDLAGDRS